ncbi:MAG TPA: HlyD family type I secretion periplasmic adaptor subunit [Steroidobacter sp.]|uniref:HlyD family type I secretion periplasmic adaptor subunit n=1 Tax=Steroidobacter sp. TaxID=1978227 RepID=UPI002ED7D1A2
MTHVLQAWKEFAGRYADAFRSAWSMRETLDPPNRSGDELAFLPAHLELIETPVSPSLRWTMRLIIGLFCVALLWSILGKLDIVAVAPGRTVVSSRTKILQPMETAVVRRILVRDGQAVKAGDLLIELDATSAAAELEQANETLINARLAEARYAAIEAALRTGDLDPIQVAAPVPRARLEATQQLASSEFNEYQARQQSLQATISVRRAEADTVRSQIAPLEESVRIARERSATLARLLDDKYISRHDYLAREQERVDMERLLTAQQARLQETVSAISAASDELRVLNAETRQRALDGLRQAREQIGQFTAEVSKTQQRSQLMQLRAPVDGTVQQLAIHTVGGVVTPAQELLAIVPSAEALEVEATVLNKDIGFVRAGQSATVKIESFPYTRYGYLEGIVESVSHDAAQDENLGLVFQARVRLSDASLLIDGVTVALTPGMALSVEIKTGRRRVIDYVLSPLRQHQSESMRER